MGHPAYSEQLYDEIWALIALALEDGNVTQEQAQEVLLRLAGELQPFEPPTVRGEVV